MISPVIYKDDLPSNSIENFRNFLLKYFDLTESSYISTIDGIFSHRLEIRGTGIGTNGKGSSPEYARASAYGEFIERLSNIMLIKASGSDIPKVRLDVVKLSSKLFIASTFLQNYKNNEYYFKKLNAVKNNSNDFCYAVPYKNVIEGTVEYVPTSFLSFYGSNGMAAGNSFYEMSVQALSEIFERYALKQILEHKEKVFLYSNDYIAELFPSIGKIIKQIQSEGYSVKVYDCSLEKELPCYAVAFFAVDGSYSVSFGAHPLAEYAILRCFTEINQGYEKILCKSARNKKTISAYYNLRRIFHNGFGVYPVYFLNETAISKNTNLLMKRYSSNQEMYEFCINKIIDLGFSVFYHDASYLGFSSGHYIIPGMSDIFIPNEELLEFLNCKKNMFSKFENFLDLSYDEQNLLLELFDYFFNTYQYETDIRYLSKYSNESSVNLFVFMILGFSIISKKEKSKKYINLLSQNPILKIDNNLIEKLSSVINADIESAKKMLAEGCFRRVIISSPLVEKYFPILLGLQKEYYK